MGWSSQIEYQSGRLCRGTSGLSATWTYCPVFSTQAFDGVDLASHILWMVPRNWQDQYTVLQSVQKLLKVLECTQKAYPTKKEHEGPKAGAAGGDSSKKRMVSFSDQIPKKSFKEAKHCALCKKHGDAQNTHNTEDCKKYSKKGLCREKCAVQPMHPSCIARAEHQVSAVVCKGCKAWKV